MAQDNRSLARFELTGIPPAPRGVPKVQVTFRIDANGILSVEAKDLGTGRTQAISITPTSGLTQDEITRLVDEGERFKETDGLRRELAELKNQADTLIYTTQQALEGYADLLAPDKIAAVRADIAALQHSLNAASDLTTIREAYSRLENATFEIAEAMYGPSDG
jgi:molecular chaperone DnaK